VAAILEAVSEHFSMKPSDAADIRPVASVTRAGRKCNVVHKNDTCRHKSHRSRSQLGDKVVTRPRSQKRHNK
jgi:hypothetical protein